MTKSDAQRIYECLVQETLTVGEHHVLAAIKMWKRAPKGDTERGPRPRIPRQWIETAWSRQHGRCNICKREMLLSEAAGDHIKPWSKGGPHKAGNIAAVHDVRYGGTCNQEKGARGLVEESKRSGNLMTEMIPHGEEEA